MSLGGFVPLEGFCACAYGVQDAGCCTKCKARRLNLNWSPGLECDLRNSWGDSSILVIMLATQCLLVSHNFAPRRLIRRTIKFLLYYYDCLHFVSYHYFGL